MWTRILSALPCLAICGFLATAGAAQADPNPLPGENWKTDFTIHSVDLSQIRSGGPPKDGIPAIDEPAFVAVGEASHDPMDPVIVLAINGDARAYPLSVLMWHEIANDVIGGKPVTVTYCPLCNAAIAFSRELEGQVLDFGTTGRLRNSDLVMYDRQTETWWQQFSGRAIIGALTGKRLEMIASTTLPFAEFAREHPRGKVLVPNNPGQRRYGANPYAWYDSAKRPFLYNGAMPQGVSPMERVIIAETGEEPVIVTMTRLQEVRTLEFGDLKLEWTAGMASALDAPVISQGRDVGYVRVTRSGKPAVYHVTFAFVAHAFHPDVAIRGKPG